MPVDVMVRLDPTRTGLVPCDSAQAEILSDLRPGKDYRAEVTGARNPLFHRRVMALIRFCFGQWDPAPLVHKGREVERDFESFRAEMLILAGHYTVTHRLNGDVRLKPRSISFAKCDETEFQRVYSGLINVALRNITSMRDMSEAQVGRAVDEIMRHAS